MLVPKWRFCSLGIIPSFRFEEVTMVFKNMYTQYKQATKVHTKQERTRMPALLQNVQPLKNVDEVTKEGNHKR